MKNGIIQVESQAVILGTATDSQDSLIQRWINFVDRSEQTAKTYTAAVKRFYKWMGSNGITSPTRQDIINYREEMLQTLKPASVKLNLNAVKLFISWLSSEGLYLNVSANVHAPKVDNYIHSRDALTVDEGRAVLKAMPTTTEINLRDKAIMALMITCGLRSVEVVRLDVEDIERRRGQFFIRVWGKGRSGKLDSVPLPQQVYNLIQRYLNVRRQRGRVNGKAPLFVSFSIRDKDERLQTQTISRMVKKSFRAVGLDSERLTCHSCRHTYASVALDLGVDLRTIQKTLRHKSLTVTEVYLHDADNFKNKSTDLVADNFFEEVF